MRLRGDFGAGLLQQRQVWGLRCLRLERNSGTRAVEIRVTPTPNWKDTLIPQPMAPKRTDDTYPSQKLELNQT